MGPSLTEQHWIRTLSRSLMPIPKSLYPGIPHSTTAHPHQPPDRLSTHAERYPVGALRVFRCPIFATPACVGSILFPLEFKTPGQMKPRKWPTRSTFTNRAVYGSTLLGREVRLHVAAHFTRGVTNEVLGCLYPSATRLPRRDAPRVVP